MSASTHPNLPIKYGWTLAESGWNTDMDANLTMLATLTGLAVKDRDLTAPPGSPTAGDRYSVAAGATGAWAGHDGHVAVWINAAWTFYTPKVGLSALIEDESVLSIFKASGWSAGLAI